MGKFRNVRKIEHGYLRVSQRDIDIIRCLIYDKKYSMLGLSKELGFSTSSFVNRMLKGKQQIISVEIKSRLYNIFYREND